MALSIDILDDDAALVRAVQAGDLGAYTALFERHYPAVRRVCARRLQDIGEADEVAQAAFVRALERIDRCCGERRFGGWVQVIAQRLCLDTIRARTRTQPSEEPIPPASAPAASHTEDLPEESFLRKERAAQLSQALGSLPPRQRQVVVARHLDGQGPAEIAASLGLSVGAVDSLLLRARRRLAMSMHAVTGGEAGAASLPTTAITAAAASGVASDPIRLVRAIGRAWDSASYHLATALGLAPATTSARQAMAALATGAALLGAGAAAPAPHGRPADRPPAAAAHRRTAPVEAARSSPVGPLPDAPVARPPVDMPVAPVATTQPARPGIGAQPPAVPGRAVRRAVPVPQVAGVSVAAVQVPPVTVPPVTVPPVTVPPVTVPPVTVPPPPPLP